MDPSALRGMAFAAAGSVSRWSGLGLGSTGDRLALLGAWQLRRPMFVVLQVLYNVLLLRRMIDTPDMLIEVRGSYTGVLGVIGGIILIPLIIHLI